MLRITESTSASGAKAYYTEGLSREDYYSEGHEIVGHWGGRAAALLGLKGPVDRDAFFALCDNLHPKTGASLTARQKTGRRVGYDFTFNAPKSVSLLYAFTGDDRILDAFRSAVAETMHELEAEMKTRVRKGGAQESRVTGNLVWAEFVHFTGRPVGGLPDPNLHAHCFAQNATFDPIERRWKAGEFADLMRDRPYFEAAFHARLGAAMRGLGYGIERHGKWWDVAGLSRPLIEKFSRRTAEIEAKAAELGITDADAKAALGARTRSRKADHLGKDELTGAWLKRLTPAERGQIAQVVSDAADGSANFGERLSVGEAVSHAIGSAFERASVTSDKQLREAALRRGVGSVLPEALDPALRGAGVVSREVEGRRLVTTRDVLAEEQAMIAFARDGRGACRPLASVAQPEIAAFLNRDQAAAVTHALTSPDRVILVEGGAGTGKTTLMKELKAGIEAGGRHLFAFAPTADASRGVLRAEGFESADTVSRLLVDEVLQQRLRGQVILIDEAGLLGVRTLRRVFRLAEALDSRVILSGDTRQHASVERGDALRLLIDKAGLRPAAVREIVRQRGAYRDAVAALARGDMAGGFASLRSLGWVEEVAESDRHRALARDYLAAVAAGKSALVVSPTHAEGGRVTTLIREAKKQDGTLGAIDQSFFALRNLAWTEAERSDPAQYRTGLIVQFFRDAPGIKKGDRLQVEGWDEEGRVLARSGDGTVLPLPVQLAARFQVYEPFVLGLAKGDQVRVTQNGATGDGAHKLNNGSMHTVAGFTREGDVLLANGWVIGRDFGHLAHGYCTTSHASQGKTVDLVFVAQGSESFPATSREQFYVSVSRGREGVRIYTDDADALGRRIRESGQRGSATELLEGALSKPAGIEARLRTASERTKRLAAYAQIKARHIAGLMGERVENARVEAIERWQAARGQGDGSAPHMDR